MRLYPFSKPNCIAMLNTLYPPTHTIPPTPQLTPTILTSQRHAFFRYIQAVEKNGKGVLANLENQSKRPQDPNGWSVVREIVDKYLRTANLVIDDCVAVNGPEDFERKGDGSKRADSGVSFGSLERPATNMAASYHKQSSSFDKGGKDKLSRSNSTNTNKPLPASPVEACPPTPSKRGGSTLERIAREIRRMKSRSADSKEQKEEKEKERERSDESGDSSRHRPSLRKMRSASALGRAESKSKGEGSRGTSGERGAWEIDEARRRELIREAVAMRERERGKENPGLVRNEF